MSLDLLILRAFQTFFDFFFRYQPVEKNLLGNHNA